MGLPRNDMNSYIVIARQKDVFRLSSYFSIFFTLNPQRLNASTPQGLAQQHIGDSNPASRLDLIHSFHCEQHKWVVEYYWMIRVYI